MIGERANQEIEKWRGSIVDLAEKIWDDPEPSYKEYKASEWTAELLREAGFTVTRGCFGLETAVHAVWGQGKPVIGFLAEYDAIPAVSQKKGSTVQERIPGQEYGHGCGHNLLGTAHVGAVIGLKAEMEERGLPGTIVFYGCPAEEKGNGKVVMAANGAFRELDAHVSFHPGDTNNVNFGTLLAIRSVRFHFYGHEECKPIFGHFGTSALIATELMNSGMAFTREFLSEGIHIHNIINEGGRAANVVPRHASVLYYLRARDMKTLDSLFEHACDVAKGAAIMADCDYEAEVLGGCYDSLNNYTLGQVLYHSMLDTPQEAWTEEEIAFAKALNEQIPEAHAQACAAVHQNTEIHEGVCEPMPREIYGSSDVSDVQHIAPGIMFGTACRNLGCIGHSWQSTATAGMSIGFKGMIYAAKSMALFGLRLIENPEYIAKAREEFLRATEGQEYRPCPGKGPEDQGR